MAIESLSDATQYDPESKVIATREANLLVNGESSTSFTDLSLRAQDVVGVENFLVFARQVPGVAPDDRGDTETKDYIYAHDQWRLHLLRRELAVRTLELGIRAGMPTNDIGAVLIEESKDSVYDKPFNLLKRNKPTDRVIRKLVTKALDDGDSIGDEIAKARIHMEDMSILPMFSTAFELGSHHDALSMKRDHKQVVRARYSKLMKERRAISGALRQSDFDIIKTEAYLKLINPARLNDTERELHEYLESAVAVMGRIRGRKKLYNLYSDEPAQYQYTPANLDLFEAHAERAPAIEETVVFRQERTEEEIEAGRRARQEQDERLRAREEAAAAKVEAEKQAIAEHNAPILEELERIKAEYDQLVNRFKAQPKGRLKQSGIIGNNSLTYTLSQLKNQNLESAEPIARVYEGLADVVRTSGENAEKELTDILLKIEELRAEFTSYLNEHPLRNGASARLEKIGEGFINELDWLTTHWNDFKTSHAKSSYKPANIDELAQVAYMIGIGREEEMVEDTDEPEIPDIAEDEPTEELVPDEIIVTPEEPEVVPEEEPASVPVHEVEYESPLAKANRLAEQLNWVVLPNEIITPDDLVDIAEDVTRKRSKDHKPAQVERYRMESLLQLRDAFGGTLYRSEERMLDDTNNLYFVLRFQHPGDDNFYAVAENPVYGNATYVLREDALPLMQGESVLAALQLYRRDARDLGAKRIIHGTPKREVHLEKINEKLVELSEKERVA